MKSRFLSLDMECIFFGTLADLFRSAFHAVGQDVSDALAAGHLVQKFEHPLAVAERDGSSAQVLGAQNALFAKFHGKGHG